ncbi:MAG: HD domain-containing protein [Bdellovibrionales bacterium]|nr:HD domain-containing protein [Bdellovibrionales bacterium]
MSIVSFADVAFPSVSFDSQESASQLVLELIDTEWFQRLRDISQTANTRLVYMFSEHSRFGHCVGVAFLAKFLLDHLSLSKRDLIEPYRGAVLAAALLHDIGHLAPGSHTAYKTWFPDAVDIHEELACRIISESTELRSILENFDPGTTDTVCAILREEHDLPPWTWEVISGGGWNADRGNWCIVDSVLAGVRYGQYNIEALVSAIGLSQDGHLILRENRLDAMMHFALSRHAMYRQVYQHRTLMASDTLNTAIAQRARDLQDKLEFQDPIMRRVLKVTSPFDLSLEELFEMKESWWRYHLSQWSRSNDSILADLSQRLLFRRLFKTIRVLHDEDEHDLFQQAKQAVRQAGYDPQYYLHRFGLSNMHRGDHRQSMLVLMDDNSVKRMKEAEPLFGALMEQREEALRSWIALPKEAKELLGRER